MSGNWSPEQGLRCAQPFRGHSHHLRAGFKTHSSAQSHPGPAPGEEQSQMLPLGTVWNAQFCSEASLKRGALEKWAGRTQMQGNAGRSSAVMGVRDSFKDSKASFFALPNWKRSKPLHPTSQERPLSPSHWHKANTRYFQTKKNSSRGI